MREPRDEPTRLLLNADISGIAFEISLDRQEKWGGNHSSGLFLGIPARRGYFSGVATTFLIKTK
jgi:hypothetical protein